MRSATAKRLGKFRSGLERFPGDLQVVKDSKGNTRTTSLIPQNRSARRSQRKCPKLSTLRGRKLPCECGSSLREAAKRVECVSLMKTTPVASLLFVALIGIATAEEKKPSKAPVAAESSAAQTADKVTDVSPDQ